MRSELPGLRVLVTGPTKKIRQVNAVISGAEVAINGRKKAKVDSIIGEIRGTVPSGRLVGAPGDTAGEVNIRVNYVGT